MHQQGRILIVDDQEMNIIMLEELLADGYQLAVAMSGEEAIHLATEFQPDLILLDIIMPGMDGYETCRKLRQLPELGHTKIMMVSAKDRLDDRLHGYMAGADDYLTKPYDEDELLAKIRVYQRLKSVEELDQLKTGMLSLLNHETRTPLNGILGTLQILREHDDLDEKDRCDFFEMMHQSAQTLSHYIEQVGLLSQMQAGHWQLELAPANLSNLIHIVAHRFATKLQEQDITLVTKVPQDVESILDAAQMQRVLSILLDNAIQFSSPQTSVKMELSCDSEYHYLLVIDEGPGISSEYIPYIFQGFLDANIKHHSAGHGLSLAIARHIVHAHSGMISVQSKVEHGSTFTVKLPRSNKESTVKCAL